MLNLFQHLQALFYFHVKMLNLFQHDVPYEDFPFITGFNMSM